MFKNKRALALAGVAVMAGLAAGPAWAGDKGTGAAVPIKVTAPYAQAAAVVNADGSLNRAKGINAVTKPGVGQYCVELEDKDLDITKLVPSATLQYTSFEYGIRISMWPHPACGTQKNTFHVITGMPNKWEDRAFSFVVM
ncbi:hypothetical protein [Streptosporangium sp. NPDC023615]|uniref:hypothetical protein n=1 Tax=Streptosporangium sp. NPDC023615 TaxID=3154794 RepID=UPI003447E552